MTERWFALALAAMMLAAGAASAQDRPDDRAPGAPAAPVKTSKERLSEKAADQQRVDDCGVPAEKRGPKSRPDGCEHRTAPAVH